MLPGSKPEVLSELERALLPSGGRLVLHNGLRLNQNEAERKCRDDYGGSLAIVRSEEDFRLVEAYLLPQISRSFISEQNSRLNQFVSK